MHSVVLNGEEPELTARVKLAGNEYEEWYMPPHWFDSILQVGGMAALNGGDTVDTRDFFYMSPGWGSVRMTRRLVAGGEYTAYVRMALLPNSDKVQYTGGVYMLQNGEVVALTSNLRFVRLPRSVLARYLSPVGGLCLLSTIAVKPLEESMGVDEMEKTTSGVASDQPSSHTTPPTPLTHTITDPNAAPSSAATPSARPAGAGVASQAHAESPILIDCLQIISRETGLEVESLTDGATLVELGIDSLMSLVLSEKFHSELTLDIKSSVILDCGNIGALKKWLV